MKKLILQSEQDKMAKVHFVHIEINQSPGSDQGIALDIEEFINKISSILSALFLLFMDVL